ncbi:family 1 glycosylhydrolase [Longispora sp. NPDC051575]|uniref:glycoside hydrolase family 1 protein n=1 Tax=Longispora sp. NPDC051575 TaxID=3154943 RepID=UPI00342C3C2F
MLGLPADFLLGAATAAYQIEGSVRADGRGPSIWDTFSHTPGRILGGDTGDVAIDHVRHLDADVAVMAGLGLDAYRFSVSWSRIQPDGRGPVNQAGLDLYSRLVDALLGAGVEPWLTLYHWDLPQALEDAGGWPARDTAYRFADYAEVVHAALGDRVTRWTTLNEPWCSAFLGYGSGVHAPGRRDGAAAVRAAHHLLLGHGLAVRRIRGAGGAPPGTGGTEVGITLNLYATSPAGPGDEDAVRRIDGLQNRFFLDPVLLGEYPADVVADLAGVTDFAHVRDGDLAVVSAPLDFLGVNYYTRNVVGAAPEGPDGNAARRDSGPTGDTDGGEPARGDGHGAPGLDVGSPWPGSEGVRFARRGLPTTAMGWEVDAPGLVEVLHRVHTEYPSPPLFVTENGAAFHDAVAPDGTVRDLERVGYLDAHLRACAEAVRKGVPLRGYFAWSLFDNFEWSWGYSRRFGLVHVDYATQRRTVKSSGAWYRDLIAAARRARGADAPG